MTGTLFNKTVVALASGSSHSAALCSDGRVATWGSNDLGQLGNSNGANSLTPVAVDTTGILFGKQVVAIAAGSNHTLALSADGSVTAWGQNNQGQLGNNSRTDTASPVAVTTIGTPLAGRTVVAIAAGQYHSLALCSDGLVVAWGDNGNGALGNNDNTYTDSLLPVAVTTAGTPFEGKTALSIGSGSYHSFAAYSDGTIAAWGNNTFGQLGDGTTTNAFLPVSVTTSGTPLAGKSVIAIAGGQLHTIALCSDGTLAAWGFNTFGELGNGNTANSFIPVSVKATGTPLTGKKVVKLGVGGGHAVAVCSDGTIASWGSNASGQLGQSTGILGPAAVDTTNLRGGERFTIVSNGNFSAHTLGLAAQSPPEIAVFDSSPSGIERQDNVGSVNFANIAVGTSTSSQTFTIQNTGSATLTGLTLSIAGADPSQFILSALGGTTTLAIGGSTTFTVAFSPTSIGGKNAVVNIASDDLDENPFRIRVTGAPDTTPPTLPAVAVTSNNVATGWAKAGDTVTINFASSEPIQSPVVTIGGQLAAVLNAGGNQWNASIGVGAGIAQGSGFSINFSDLSGNAGAAVTTSTDSSSVSIDVTGPVLTLPGNQTIEATSGSGATVSYGAVSATDNLGSFTLTSLPITGGLFQIGTTAVNVTATDTAGNTTSGNFTVTVDDTTEPILTLPQNIVVGATSETGAIVTFSPTASDSVSPPVIVSTPASGLLFPIGDTVITVTATDSAGNSSNGTFTVRVETANTGNYNGLAEPTDASTNPGENVGAITLTVKSSGAFTGKLKLGGTSGVVVLKGIIGSDGTAYFGATPGTPKLRIIRQGKATLDLSLSLDQVTSPQMGKLIGHLEKTDAVIVATIEADRALYTAQSQPVPPMLNVPMALLDPLTNKGKYTVLCRAKTVAQQGMPASEFPQGDGWALLTVLKTGSVKVVGKLADGTPFTCVQPLSQANKWPFYVALYKGKGSISGVISFREIADTSDADGMGLRWFRPIYGVDQNFPYGRPLRQGEDRLYPGGWPAGILTDCYSSKYVPPAAGSGLTALLTPGETLPSLASNATLDLMEGLLAVPSSQDVSISTTDRVTMIQSTDPKLKCVIASKTGVLTGGFTHLVNSKYTVFKGVIFQKQHFGGGYFIGTPASGSVLTSESGSVKLLPAR